jgi:uncharacterized membrane protein
MDFETAKILLGVGLILQIIGSFTWLGDAGAVMLVGAVLALVGAHGLADYYSRRDIFNNLLYAYITALVGVVVAAVALVGWFIHAAISAPWALPKDLYGIVFIAVGIWVLVWLIKVAATYFERRAYRALYEATGSDNFQKAATFVWIGALTYVVLVGFLIYIIGLIFAIIGAFELKPRQAEGSAKPPHT